MNSLTDQQGRLVHHRYDYSSNTEEASVNQLLRLQQYRFSKLTAVYLDAFKPSPAVSLKK